jgi:flagellar biosynthesis component FlhA
MSMLNIIRIAELASNPITMTPWFFLLTNPVVYFFTVACLLGGLYIFAESNSIGAIWSLLFTNIVFATGVYIALSVVNQLRNRQLGNSAGTELYQVFEPNNVLTVNCGKALLTLARKPEALQAEIAPLRQQLAEQYGYVVPEVQTTWSSKLHPNQVDLLVRDELIASLTVYPDCMAVPVDRHDMDRAGLPMASATALADCIDDQWYVWTPTADVTLQDKAIALEAKTWLLAKMASVLLDNAHVVISRNDAMRLMAIVQNQDPGIFHELFELNKLPLNAFRQQLGQRLHQRQSIRQITQVCDSLLRSNVGVSRLSQQTAAFANNPV